MIDNNQRINKFRSEKDPFYLQKSIVFLLDTWKISKSNPIRRSRLKIMLESLIGNNLRSSTFEYILKELKKNNIIEKIESKRNGQKIYVYYWLKDLELGRRLRGSVYRIFNYNDFIFNFYENKIIRTNFYPEFRKKIHANGIYWNSNKGVNDYLDKSQNRVLNLDSHGSMNQHGKPLSDEARGGRDVDRRRDDVAKPHATSPEKRISGLPIKGEISLVLPPNLDEKEREIKFELEGYDKNIGKSFNTNPILNTSSARTD